MNRIYRGALCAILSLGLFPAAANARTELPSRGAIGGTPTPGMFGTLSLDAGQTPYDARWRRVLRSGLPPANQIAVHARRLAGLERLTYVNVAVNRAIAYRGDSQNWGSLDHWATASETLARGAGDCEDYAVAKMHVLRNAGVPAADLFLVVGDDLGAGAAHAVLVVRLGHEFWVLDNLRDEVRPARDYRSFRPILSFSTGGASLHGYPRNSGSVALAGNHSAGIGSGANASRLASVIAAQAQR